jgi:hypothetical protein
MSTNLSGILRRKLDDILEELESAPCSELTFEHMDLLEKRFFSLHETMECILECEPMSSRPLSALQLSRALSRELRDLFAELCIEQEPEFSNMLIDALEMRFRHLQDVFDDQLEQYASQTLTSQGDRL